MYEIPLQDVAEHCKKCLSMKRTLQKEASEQLDINSLGKQREECAECRTLGAGIYKADAIIGTIKKQKPPLGKGKRCTIPESIQRRVLEYHYEGMTQQKIAEIIGVSRGQVQRVIARLKALNKQKEKEESDGNLSV